MNIFRGAVTVLPVNVGRWKILASRLSKIAILAILSNLFHSKNLILSESKKLDL